MYIRFSTPAGSMIWHQRVAFVLCLHLLLTPSRLCLLSRHRLPIPIHSSAGIPYSLTNDFTMHCERWPRHGRQLAGRQTFGLSLVCLRCSWPSVEHLPSHCLQATGAEATCHFGSMDTPAHPPGRRPVTQRDTSKKDRGWRRERERERKRERERQGLVLLLSGWWPDSQWMDDSEKPDERWDWGWQTRERLVCCCECSANNDRCCFCPTSVSHLSRNI